MNEGVHFRVGFHGLLGFPPCRHVEGVVTLVEKWGPLSHMLSFKDWALTDHVARSAWFCCVGT